MRLGVGFGGRGGARRGAARRAVGLFGAAVCGVCGGMAGVGPAAADPVAPAVTSTPAAPVTSPAPALPTGPSASAAPSTPAPAGVTCVTPSVPLYQVDPRGSLVRWNFTTPLTGAAVAARQTIGTGWNGATVLSAGDGVLFLIDAAGNLHWYKDQTFNGSGGWSWAPGSGSVIATGWNGYRLVQAAGNGVLYTIDAEGNLFWFRYTGTGGPTDWSPDSGVLIGIGWQGLTRLVPGGGGVLYAVDTAGTLWWYRHSDPDAAAGAVTWAANGAGVRVGTGWGLGGVGSVGGGVLYARTASGSVLWYRHLDPQGGSAVWANQGAATVVGAGWTGAVLPDSTGCAAAG